MAGTVVVTTSKVSGSGVRKYALAWTSDGNGVVSGNTFEMVSGAIVAATFLPGSGGTQPTNLYDITVLCTVHGVDVLNDEGLNLSNAAGSHHSVYTYNADKTAHFRQWMHGGVYELRVANAGAAKTGSMEIYVSPGVL